VAKIARKVVAAFLTRAKVDETLISFFSNVLYILILTFVIIAAISKLGVETTSLAAMVAAAALAIGLSLQSSLSNLASGVMIIGFAPFKNDDYVEIAGTSGTVKEISIFTTTLITPDNKTVIVPNGNILTANITNYSTQTRRRIDLVIGVSYEDDLKKVKKTLEKIIASDSRILTTPEPKIAVCELADSSVNFVVRPWVKSKDYWDTRFDLLETIKTTFDKENINIPYPQQFVHLKKVA